MRCRFSLPLQPVSGHDHLGVGAAIVGRVIPEYPQALKNAPTADFAKGTAP